MLYTSSQLLYLAVLFELADNGSNIRSVQYPSRPRSQSVYSNLNQAQKEKEVLHMAANQEENKYSKYFVQSDPMVGVNYFCRITTITFAGLSLSVSDRSLNL
jgi:hypothetical protein